MATLNPSPDLDNWNKVLEQFDVDDHTRFRYFELSRTLEFHRIEATRILASSRTSQRIDAEDGRVGPRRGSRQSWTRPSMHSQILASGRARTKSILEVTPSRASHIGPENFLVNIADA